MTETATASTLQLPPCDYQPPPYTGPSRDEVLALRGKHYNPAVFTLYAEPIMVVDGHMQYLFDERGGRYLDLFAGIVTTGCGHCHPKITARIREQASRLQHATTLYLHPNVALAAERLVATLPPELDTVLFTNSGSEANDMAVTMARLYTGNTDLIGVRNAYHGGTSSTLGFTSHSTWKYPVGGGGPVHHAINPHPYRSPFSGTPEEIAEKSAEDIRDLVRFTTSGSLAAFLAEPIQGVGGVTYGAPNYLGLAYDVVRESGGLCIADEVQGGFGRTGTHYWSFQNWGVVPDVVTTAKSLGNGAPIAAVVTRREIAEVLTQRIHFNTFAGNAMSTAAALAVLEVVEEDRLQERSLVLGGRLKAGLEALAERHPLVGDVRGMGLILGVELVRDRTTKEPASTEAMAVLEAARERRVLVGKGGFYGNVLRIKPPMCLTEADVDYAVAVLDEALSIAAR